LQIAYFSDRYQRPRFAIVAEATISETCFENEARRCAEFKLHQLQVRTKQSALDEAASGPLETLCHNAKTGRFDID
jgi:hypothetical protein